MLVTSPMFIFPGKEKKKRKRVYVKPLMISDPFHSDLAYIPKTTPLFQQRIVCHVLTHISCPDTLGLEQSAIVWYF